MSPKNDLSTSSTTISSYLIFSLRGSGRFFFSVDKSVFDRGFFFWFFLAFFAVLVFCQVFIAKKCRIMVVMRQKGLFWGLFWVFFECGVFENVL